jgi:hypothetical protein
MGAKVDAAASRNFLPSVFTPQTRASAGTMHVK